MSAISLDDGDVVSMPKGVAPIGNPTWRVSQFVKALRDMNWTHWIEGGTECEVLQLGSENWRKGKIRLRLEFVPDPEE